MSSYSEEVNAARSRQMQDNDNSLKLKTPELKREAYKQYCKHLAEGYNKHSFFFKHPELTLTAETMDKYIRENPSDFDPCLLRVALAERFKYWENEGKKIMTGKYKGGSPVVWQTFMRNMFRAEGWDRIEVNPVSSDVQITMQRMMGQITSYQKRDIPNESIKEIPLEEQS